MDELRIVEIVLGRVLLKVLPVRFLEPRGGAVTQDGGDLS